MKVYVRDYETVELPLQAPPLKVPENITVGYSETPEWRMSDFDAEYELKTLQSMNVHVAEHYCNFVLEKLAEDEFAIICESHPTLSHQSA